MQKSKLETKSWPRGHYETKEAGGDEYSLAELKAAFGEHDEAMTKRLKDLEAKMAAERDRADRLETAMNRPLRGGEEKRGPTLEEKVWEGYLRRGLDPLPETERKSLVLGDSTFGGYLAPSQFSAELLKNVVEISPVRQAARVGQMTASEILIPKRTGQPTAYWVSETESRTETGSTYGQVRITAREMATYVDISQQLIEDAAVNVTEEVAMDLAQEFGRLEGYAFLRGDGVGKPFGILNDTDIVSSVSGSATTIADSNGQADGLISAFYSLPAFYRNRASWMLNGTTLASVRKLKDGMGNYLWMPGIAAGQPDTILGRPVIEAVDMPDEGAGNTPIIIGDFQSGYRIYDRVMMSILRDGYSQATNGLVRFHARRRVGGDVVKAEAFRFVKCATS